MEQRQRPLMLKDFLDDDCSSVKSLNQHYSNTDECVTTVRYLLQTESNNRRKRVGIISSRPAFSTISALRKASEVMAKLVHFSNRPSQRRRSTTTVLQKQNTNKLSPIIKKVSSMKGTHSVKGSFARKLSRAVKSLSGFGDISKAEAGMPVRVRDIVRWRSFGNEDDSQNHFCNSTFGTSDSFSHSRRSRIWSEFGTQSFSASNFRSFSDLSHLVDGLKDDGMLLLAYRNGEEDEVSTDEAFHGSPIHQRGPDYLDSADSWCSSEHEKSNIQQIEDRGDALTVCCSLEGYKEKEQFSPVAVLDFPFEEDLEPTTSSSSSFEESLANLERTKQQLLQNISRYESLAKLDSLGLESPHLLSQTTEFSDKDSDVFTYYDGGNNVDDQKDIVEDVEGFIQEILENFLDAPAKGRFGSLESLVIDVFREELSVGGEREEAILIGGTTERIKEWLIKENETDDSKELFAIDMQMDQDWGKFKMEVGEVVVELEFEVFQRLVNELLTDLTS